MSAPPGDGARRYQWPAVYAAILVLGVFLRTIALEENPPGLWFDEANYALDGLSIGRDGALPLAFDKDGHPREPLFSWSLGLWFALFEPTLWHARFVSALWGIAALAAFLPLAHRLLGPKWAAAALAIFAVFRWPVHFSRTIFRAGLSPLFLILIAWTFLRWRDSRRTADAALCGAALGAGLYTYIALRLAPLMVLLWLAWMAWRRELVWRRDAPALAAMAAACLLIASPLAIHFFQRPDHFFSRTDQVSIFREEVTVTAPDGTERLEQRAKPFTRAAADIAANAWRVALVWNVTGDHVARHGLPLRPLFDPIMGLCFLLGAVLALGRCGRSFEAWLLVTWLAVQSLTNLFSFGIPNVLRLQGASPAAVLVAIGGIRAVSHFLSTRLSAGPRRTILAAVLLLFAALQIDAQFRQFPAHPRVRAEFQLEMFVEPARACRAVAPDVERIYVPAELKSHATFDFLTVGLPGLRTYEPGDTFPRDVRRPIAILATARSEQLAGTRAWAPQIRALPGARAVRELPITAEADGALRHVPWATLYVVNAPDRTSR